MTFVNSVVFIYFNVVCVYLLICVLGLHCVVWFVICCVWLLLLRCLVDLLWCVCFGVLFRLVGCVVVFVMWGVATCSGLLISLGDLHLFWFVLWVCCGGGCWFGGCAVDLLCLRVWCLTFVVWF